MSTQAGEVGAAFLDALTTREFTVARVLVADDIRFRMLVPSGLMAESDADATIGRFIEWFGDADPFLVEASSSDEVEGRQAITYRFRFCDADGWQVIEQHLMLTIDTEGLITRIDLLCSGFRPVAARAPGQVHRFEAGDLSCADGLATEFRRQMQAIAVGELLLVSTRDPAAKEDLPPLARLMGHEVVSIETPGDGRLLVTVERRR